MNIHSRVSSKLLSPIASNLLPAGHLKYYYIYRSRDTVEETCTSIITVNNNTNLKLYNHSLPSTVSICRQLYTIPLDLIIIAHSTALRKYNNEIQIKYYTRIQTYFRYKIYNPNITVNYVHCVIGNVSASLKMFSHL